MKNQTEKILLNFLQEKQYASVEDLSGVLSVSPSTVRRLLTQMEGKGLVKRTHGGAKINDQNNFFPSFTFRSHQNSLEKKKIALSAIKLIKDGDVIFLDGSTSAFFIAEYLSQFNNIKVITNGIDTLSLLSKNKINAYSTGGCISQENRSVLVGHHAIEMINTIHADITFFSAQSINKELNIFDCFEEENVLRKRMLKNSTTSVLLCDSTKFGQHSPYYLCSLNQVDYIATDKNIPEYIDLSKLTNPPKLITL